MLFSDVLVSFGVLLVLQVIERKLRFEGQKCKEVEVLWKSDQVHGYVIEHICTRMSGTLERTPSLWKN